MKIGLYLSATTFEASNHFVQVNEFAKAYMPTCDEEVATVEAGEGKDITVDGCHQNNNLSQ